MKNVPKDPVKFELSLVDEYMKYTSVENAIRENVYDLPISYSQYQKILSKWGVVKTAGRNNKFSESLNLLTKISEENIPVNKIIKRMPKSFQTSSKSIYNTLRYIKHGVTRRVATALIVSPYNDLQKTLIAKDKSTPRIEYGKYHGSLTIPMTFARKTDSHEKNIDRVLQHEVFTNLLVEGKYPKEIVNNSLKPFAYVDLADVRIAVYAINLPKNLSNLKSFSSYKLDDYKFRKVDSISKSKNGIYRAGVSDIISLYIRFLTLKNKNFPTNPIYMKSSLNGGFN